MSYGLCRSNLKGVIILGGMDTDFDYESAKRSNQRREDWNNQIQTEQLNREKAFIKEIKPVIFNRLRVMLNLDYMPSGKENPWPPQPRHFQTNDREFVGWVIGEGQPDGWGDNLMLLCLNGKVISFRERTFRNAKFIGEINEEPLTETQRLKLSPWKELGISAAYDNLYDFASALGIPNAEIETIRLAVGPLTRDERAAAMDAD